MGVRILIHNLGTRDLHLEDEAGNSLLTGNHLVPPEWQERLARRPRVGVDAGSGRAA